MKRRKHMLEDLDRDISEHIERETQDNIDRGVPPEEARYAALRKFGNVARVKEDTREVWSTVWLEHLAQDIRYGLRMLRKSPGFTAVAVLTLALGIGANTTIFSLIDAVMLRSLPVRDPQRLLILKWTALHDPNTTSSYSWAGCPGESNDSATRTWGGCSFSYPMFEQIRAERNVFSAVSAFAKSNPLHVTANGRVSIATGNLVSGDFFSTLGVRAILGRALDPMDDDSSAQPTVVLSYGFWQSQFGSDPSVVGKSILVENVPLTIVGIGAPEFSGIEPGLPTDIWMPLSSQAQIAPYFPKHTAANSLWIEIVGRLSPGVSISQGQSALTVIFAPGSTSGPTAVFKPDDDPRIELKSAAGGLVSLRQEFSQPLFVLMASVGIILLIACANVAGLSLARATSRQQEMAIRFTLGATRGRIARQLLTESLLIATTGGLLGILLAYWSASVLAAFLAANWYTPLKLDVHPDRMVLGFTIAVVVLTGVLFGLAPTLRGMRVDLAPAIKGNGGKVLAVFATRRFGFGSFLVVAQVALSVVVLAGAGLLVRTLVNLRTLNFGFDTRNVLLFYADTTMTHSKGSQSTILYRQLRDRIAALPGVVSASYSMVALLSDANMDSQFSLQESPDKKVSSNVLPVGPRFFETMHVLLLAGRAFATPDFTSVAKPEPAVVNESLAHSLFGTNNPLGRRFGESGTETRYMVIGLVRDAKYSSIRREAPRTVYVPLQQDDGAEFELRTVGDPRAFVSAVRGAVSQVNTNILMSDIKTQIEQIDQSLYQERLVASLSALFGALALLLACVGLYGLLSYEVARRTHEIGIRMALGAQQRQVLGLVVRQGLVLALIGALIGVAAAAGATRYLQSLLFGIQSTDPYTFAGVVAVLALVAILASYIPARRAMRVDPMIALRYE
jgi:predicted permease